MNVADLQTSRRYVSAVNFLHRLHHAITQMTTVSEWSTDATKVLLGFYKSQLNKYCFAQRQSLKNRFINFNTFPEQFPKLVQVTVWIIKPPNVI